MVSKCSALTKWLLYLLKTSTMQGRSQTFDREGAKRGIENIIKIYNSIIDLYFSQTWDITYNWCKYCTVYTGIERGSKGLKGQTYAVIA